jgi:hypothetical protein
MLITRFKGNFQQIKTAIWHPKRAFISQKQMKTDKHLKLELTND